MIAISSCTGALTGFLPIGLAELTERAALQTRVDRKYLVPLAEVPRLLTALQPVGQVLTIDGLRTFRYESVYFDTPDLVSFRLTAHRRRRRFKVRTRTYLDSGHCWLEVKTEGVRGGTVKERVPYRRDDSTVLSPGRSFVDGVLGPVTDGRALTFAPTLVTRYLRTTLYLPTGGSRATVDVGLSWEDESGRRLDLPDLAIVETKTASAVSPVDRLLWRNGHRPVAVSKYATGLAALHPDLPAARWRRILRRHFVPTAGATQLGELFDRPAEQSRLPLG
ncbi:MULTISPECIES: polyphosphate polymerase domain-containing protein [Micromonospora]|uniref:VTC domain-containing protein n=1 Tax=Micromonospora yangpuensis TaxID=683228 RepID=A0A1C6UHR9_9ACTN|nr:polyphosphate polymerase domain-containing protein [Micromonospora yangpuensis]GGM03606.1 VTC domain-containing protein [Micromonospora yangpuensis]SCL53635.1 VTC domain-containing protein [Micromonospora yangpuensis]